MDMFDGKKETFLVMHDGKYRWFRSEREPWVLDTVKWEQAFVDAGYSPSEPDPEYRFGIEVVNEKNANKFLTCMKPYETTFAELKEEFLFLYPMSTWQEELEDFYPVAFINFDQKHVATYYLYGVGLENYVPPGWTGTYENFCVEYSEKQLPYSERFWLQNGKDLIQEQLEKIRAEDRNQ